MCLTDPEPLPAFALRTLAPSLPASASPLERAQRELERERDARVQTQNYAGQLRETGTGWRERLALCAAWSRSLVEAVAQPTPTPTSGGTP